jgi:hypothetical protein
VHAVGLYTYFKYEFYAVLSFFVHENSFLRNCCFFYLSYNNLTKWSKLVFLKKIIAESYIKFNRNSLWISAQARYDNEQSLLHFALKLCPSRKRHMLQRL